MAYFLDHLFPNRHALCRAYDLDRGKFSTAKKLLNNQEFSASQTSHNLCHSNAKHNYAMSLLFLYLQLIVERLLIELVTGGDGLTRLRGRYL